MRWFAVSLQAYGGWALARKTERGTLEYHVAGGPATLHARAATIIGSSADAQAKARTLNGETPRLTPEQFAAQVAHVPMTPGMAAALWAIMVEGWTWARAAKRGGVTESGIKRALDRVKQRSI